MREIIAISNENEIATLRTFFRLAGADPVFARDLNDAFELIERTQPVAVFVTENSDPSAEICLRELKRHTPSLPVCIMLKKRDSESERKYLRLGAFSCIQYPWAPEEAASVFSLTRTAILKKIEFKPRKKKIWPIITATSVLFILTVFFSYFYGIKKERENTLKAIYPDSVKIADDNISGILFDSENVYLYNWLLQTIFKYSQKDLSSAKVKKIPYDIYRYASDFITQFVFLSDDGYLVRRAKDEQFTILEKSGPFSGFSQFCFDGIYVWTLDEKENILKKRINNAELNELQSFQLNSRPIAISCSTKNIYYAYNDYYEKASVSDPQRIIVSIKMSGEGILQAFAWNSGNIWTVRKNKDGSYLSKAPDIEKK